MKRFTFFTIALLCVLCGLVFSSSVSAKTEYREILSSIIENDLTDHSVENTQFHYNKSGYISEVKTQYNTLKIDWSGYKRGSVVMEFNNGTSSRTSTYTLDEKHHATSVTISEKSSSKDVQPVEYYYQITYSPSGKLQTITENRVEKPGGKANKKYIPTSKIEFRENSDDSSILLCNMIYYNSDGSEGEKILYKYSQDLSEIDNKGLFGMFMPDMTWGELSFAYQAGLIGVASYYLPNLIEITTSDKEGSEEILTILDWKKDSSDLPVSLHISNGKDNRMNITFVWEHRPK